MTRLLEPPDAATAAAMLAEVSSEGTPVRLRGSGTKLGWGTGTKGPATQLTTRLLASPVRHYAGDLVATIPAGAMLADVNAALAREHQWLPLDPPYGDLASIGGIVATNDSGPRRHSYGSPRDLIVGIEFALADGRVAKAGGRVVKNVAGYDLSRLLCGSFGSLALITTATFKLAPIAPFSLTLVARPGDLQQAAELALVVAAAPLSPSTLELAAPDARLLIRFETTERAAKRQAEDARRILEEANAATTLYVGNDEVELWRAHELNVFDGTGAIRKRERRDHVLFKASVLPTEVAAVLRHLAQLPGAVEWSAIGRAALGVLAVKLTGAADPLSEALLRLRTLAAARGGTLTVLEAPEEVRSRVDPWGEIGHADVMRAVKGRFDPRNVLSPGCGPGGI
jgi:glycolate oxidase FAD binding subunit